MIKAQNLMRMMMERKSVLFREYISLSLVLTEKYIKSQSNTIDSRAMSLPALGVRAHLELPAPH